jgi:serine/threonine protein kinase
MLAEGGEMIGQVVGSYRIVRKLGEGGMGAVFEGVQEQIGRHVAIKVLLASAAGNAQIAQRFFNEARATNLIDHPSLVEIFDMGHLPDGTAYIVMELLKGESLTDRIRSAPQGLGTQALRIARQIGSALAAAHDKQIVHRDLKPDNVFLVPDPEATGGERAKVLDFGIAKMAAELQSGPLKTSTQMLMGTPAYMAPEQCRSSTNVDDKADVYSLGIMLFQMLSGRLPFDASGDTMQLLYAHVHDPPPSLASVVPDAPAPLVSVLAAMLAKDPKQRPTMAEVAVTMGQLGGTITGHAQPATAQPSSPTLQMSSLASISQAAGEVAPRASVSAKSNHAILIVLGVVAFLGVGAVAVVAGLGFMATRLVRQSGPVAAASVGSGPGSSAGVATGAALANTGAAGNVAPLVAVAGAPHCGRFAKFLVPSPAGFTMTSCADMNGMSSLLFSGSGSPSAACAPMKAWGRALGWDVDAETAVAGTEALMLHKDHDQLTLSCTATGGTTMVAVALTPRP